VFPKPETQSFTKFLISAGVFLCIAGVVGPALALRETAVLRISSHELAGLTPDGRAELIHRQKIEHTVGQVAPGVGGGMLVLGLILIFSGMPRLRRQEHADQERSSAELDKLRADLRPLSDTEVKNNLKAQADEDLTASLEEGLRASRETSEQAEAAYGDQLDLVLDELVRPSTSAAGSSTAPAAPSNDDGSGSLRLSPRGEDATASVRDAKVDRYQAGRADFVREAYDVEREVLRRIREISEPLYDLRESVRFAESVEFDGVLISHRTATPDIVVEIKYVRASSLMNIARSRASEAAAALMSYQAAGRRSAIGWLILVVQHPVSAQERARAIDASKLFGNQVHISVIVRASISDLVLPPAF
jgi:hypothetical protein